jgi:signal transduction histidine kinase/CheY-like chemotaxis protein
MRFSATRLLWALVVLLIAAPVLFFSYFGWRSYHDHFANARLHLARTVEVVREHAINVFEAHELVASKVELITRDMTDADVRAKEAEIHKLLKEIVERRRQVQEIWVIDRNGMPLVTGNVFPVTKELDQSHQNYFRVFRDGTVKPNELFISRALRSGPQQDVYFQVVKARARGPNGEFNGVDVVSVEPRYFHAFFSQIAEGGLDTVVLVRNDGFILARYPDPIDALDKLPPANPFQKAIENDPGAGVYEAQSSVDGVVRLAAYEKLPTFPVYVIATTSRQAVVNAWRENFLSHMIFGVPATLALLALGLLAIRYTQRESEAVGQLRAEAVRRESAEGQLRQAQKMEAVGRLTGGVAHDFNNLLTIVIGNLDILQRRLKDADDRVRASIENARTGATRAATLTQRLLAFSRQQPLAPAVIEVNKLVAGMSDLLRRTLGETVAIETVLAGGLWRAHVDANQLESAILNLAVNARDAMPEGGKLTIETANAYLDDAYATARADVKAGQYVMIAIADTGSGMTPETVAQAFEPFFTTKPVGQGTGLGLSQVYGFVKQSSGHVAIYSEVDHGTTVKLYLPKLTNHEEQTTDTTRAEPAFVESQQEGTILVVEDDEMVRQLSVDALRDAGYTIIHSEDARRGLALLNRHPEIDLLFTDVVLTGGMNGRQLAEEAMKMRPGLKVLFTTGYTPNAIVHHGRLDEGINFIGKPFSAAALLTKVRAVLKG